MAFVGLVLNADEAFDAKVETLAPGTLQQKINLIRQLRCKKRDRNVRF